MRPVFPSAPAILAWSRRLQQSFEAEAIFGVTDSCSVDGERERVNNIYVRIGSSGPILTFFIHFEFYPTKWSIFEKNSSPMFLEFDLVFLHNFSRFFLFFAKFFDFEFHNSLNFEFGPGRICRISEKSAAFLNPGQHREIISPQTSVKTESVFFPCKLEES
jgi:hypothetical protein